MSLTKLAAGMADASLATQAELDAVSSASVTLTGDQIIAGVKTFSSQPVLPQAHTAAGTVATTSGTAVNLSTAVPVWVTRIDVALSGVSTGGTSAVILQLGTGGAFTTTGYAGSAARIDASAVASAAYGGAGFDLTSTSVAASTYTGVLTLMRMGSSHTWALSGSLAWSNTQLLSLTAGAVTLAGTLDRIRLTTAGGADTFDAGVASITYR